MTNTNQTLTEKVIDYDAEMSKNPFRILIPVKGDRIVHALMNDVRESPIINTPTKRNIVSLAEGCFYTAKYLAYSGLAIKAGEMIYNLMQ